MHIYTMTYVHEHTHTHTRTHVISERHTYTHIRRHLSFSTAIVLSIISDRPCCDIVRAIVYAYTYTYIYICVCVYTYTPIHTRAHTHTHTWTGKTWYTHTYAARVIRDLVDVYNILSHRSSATGLPKGSSRRSVDQMRYRQCKRVPCTFSRRPAESFSLFPFRERDSARRRKHVRIDREISQGIFLDTYVHSYTRYTHTHTHMTSIQRDGETATRELMYRSFFRRNIAGHASKDRNRR